MLSELVFPCMQHVNFTGSTPLLCLEGVLDLPVAPQDEAGLMKTFQTWPRGWFHIREHEWAA